MTLNYLQVSRFCTATVAMFSACIVFALVGFAATDLRGSDINPLSSADQLITVSLVPDGTKVGKSDSLLVTAIGRSVGGEQKLREIIAAACQQWAQPTNLNMTIVIDKGLPLGTRGLKQLDPRFGDVRIAAIPMPVDVRGVAFSREKVVGGTWSGDIILNAKYQFTADSLKAVLLHEIGHVLGFEHVSGFPSVLSSSNELTKLTWFDVLQLQVKYGLRDLDVYDAERPNDTIKRAVELRMHGSDMGRIPAATFGDIANVTDLDFYSFTPMEDVSDSLIIEVRSQGNSLAKLKLELLSSAGRIVAKAFTNSSGIARIVVPNSKLGKECYFVVRSQNAEFATGGYVIDAYYKSLNQISETELAEVASWNNSHLDQNDLRKRFQDGAENYFFLNDLHTNDSLATATALDPILLPTDRLLFRVDASISDALDLDYYTFVVDEESAGLPLTVEIHSRDDGLLIPYVNLLTSSGFAIPIESVVNGNGQQVLQLAGIPAGSYAIVVRRGQYSSPQHSTGNYTLELRFDRAIVPMDIYGKSEVARDSFKFHTIRVAKSQMFHFGLAASSKLNLPDTIVYTTIYGKSGEQVYQVATRPGEFRSSQSVLLGPGSYVVRVHFVDPSKTERSIGYVFSGLPDTESEGPVIIDPTASPFPKCDPKLDIFCYPEFKTADPFIWVDGLSPDLNPPTSPPSSWNDVNKLYWPDIAIV